jgi:hypothetical protein
MANLDVIVHFLQGKGLNRAAIAGIVGNLMTESGFNPDNPNPAEGAQGIAQWEGGRRTELQAYARAHGTAETDLNTQLGFMWQELSGSYSGVLSALKNVTDPSAAATIWDSQYEKSAGTSRAQRISNATTYYSGGQLKGVSTASSTGTPAAGLKLSDADYKAALGPIAGLLSGIPELRTKLSAAIAGGWSTDTFKQEIEKTAWYRQHNAATRELVAMSYSDPSEYKNRLARSADTVQTLARQMGVGLNAHQIAGLAYQFVAQSWDAGRLQRTLGQSYWNPDGTLSGQAATYTQQLKQTYGDYGVPIADESVEGRVRQMLAGNQTLDTFKQNAIASAKSMYPSLAAQIDSGLTVRDIADPYKQQMGALLEMDPNAIGVSDPLIKKALQGSVVNTGGKATATSTPLWQFEQTLRADPRWAKTNNARDTMSSALLKIGADFGFGPNG